MNRFRRSRLFLPAILLAALAGCDSTPATKPMDEPLDYQSAMEVDERLQQDTARLLKEQHEAPRPQP